MNCTNNDLDARDRRGASCESGYTSDTYYCGVFDDEDFSAFEDCCDCGGGIRISSNDDSCVAPNVPYGRELNNTACTPLSVVAAGTMCTFIPLDGFICPESPGRCEGGSFENKISRCRFFVPDTPEDPRHSTGSTFSSWNSSSQKKIKERNAYFKISKRERESRDFHKFHKYQK